MVESSSEVVNRVSEAQRQGNWELLTEVNLHSDIATLRIAANVKCIQQF